MPIIFKNSTQAGKEPLASDFNSSGMILINAKDGRIFTTKLDGAGNQVVVDSNQYFIDNNVVTSPSANKLLRLNSLGKLPASITGNAAGLDNLTKSISDLNAALTSNDVGVTVPSLVSGKIPASFLPSSVDDILEYATLSAFPATGSKSILYLDLSTGEVYRWSGSAYVKIASGDFISSIAGLTGVITAASLKTALGLDQVNNTADSAKNVLSATKLTTSRNLILGTISKSFDGQANVTWTATEIASSHTHSLSQLSDFAVSSPAANQVLAYDSASGKFINKSIDTFVINGGSF